MYKVKARNFLRTTSFNFRTRLEAIKFAGQLRKSPSTFKGIKVLRIKMNPQFRKYVGRIAR